MRLSYGDLLNAGGTDLGRSRSFLVDQSRIDAFADLTEDHQWIHVDRVLAAKSQFGSTIAHGYLTLALVAPVISELLVVQDCAFAVNYGLDKVRFPAPLPSGSMVTGDARIVDATGQPGSVQVVVRVEMRSDAAPRPVCVANSVIRFFGANPYEGHDNRTHPAYH